MKIRMSMRHTNIGLHIENVAASEKKSAVFYFATHLYVKCESDDIFMDILSFFFLFFPLVPNLAHPVCALHPTFFLLHQIKIVWTLQMTVFY